MKCSFCDRPARKKLEKDQLKVYCCNVHLKTLKTTIIMSCFKCAKVWLMNREEYIVKYPKRFKDNGTKAMLLLSARPKAVIEECRDCQLERIGWKLNGGVL